MYIAKYPSLIWSQRNLLSPSLALNMFFLWYFLHQTSKCLYFHLDSILSYVNDDTVQTIMQMGLEKRNVCNHAYTSTLIQQKTYNPIQSYVIHSMCLSGAQCDMGIIGDLPTCFWNSINFACCWLTVYIFGITLYCISVSILLDKNAESFPFQSRANS